MGGELNNKSNREQHLKKLPPLTNTRDTNNYMERKETEVLSLAKINTFSKKVMHPCSPIKRLIILGNRRMETVVTV